ncbi:MAG TPA: lipopolysaccharide heptosyltransferase II [Pyrinomonadaceae bacterium]|nr:lipopolysaccharide heptosyltransferase II [Pyrinomonadaceae bacterium]
MKILIRGTNWIGDAVMTIPAIRKVRGLFPDAEITLLTSEPTVGIFRSAHLVDEVVATGAFVEQMSAIRRVKPDLAILFPNSFRSALATWGGGARRRFGYAAQSRSMLLTDAVAVPEWKDSRHEVYYYINLVDAVEKAFDRKIDTADPAPALATPDSARAEARRILDNAGLDRTRKLIGLAPGSTNSRAKRWTPEGFARLNDRIRTELDAYVIMLGSPGDIDVSSRVAELATEKPFDLTGKTDIATAAALLAELDLLISNDMGLAHLAPAVGTETIVIFGPTNPVTTRPFSDMAAVVSANVECSPCMLRDCPIDHRCMTRISADQVFELAKAKLTERRPIS